MNCKRKVKAEDVFTRGMRFSYVKEQATNFFFYLNGVDHFPRQSAPQIGRTKSRSINGLTLNTAKERQIAKGE